MYKKTVLCCLSVLINMPFYAWALDKKTVEEGTRKIEEYNYSSMKFPNVSSILKNNVEMTTKARKIKSLTESQEYLQKVDDEKSNIMNLANKEVPKPTNVTKGEHLKDDERIYIFISSSIPLTTLRNYVADLDKLRDPRIIMVMRGFKDGMKKMQPTLDFIANIRTKDQSCEIDCAAYAADMQIDPFLFRKYQVQSVPTIIYAQGVKLADPDIGDCQQEEATNHYAVMGDASLDYSLDFINKRANAESLSRAIDALHGKY